MAAIFFGFLASFAFVGYHLYQIYPFVGLNDLQDVGLNHLQDPQETARVWLVLFGTFVAFLTFAGTHYFKHKSEKFANALSALQSLRTDKDYIEAARTIKKTLNDDFSRPVSGPLYRQLIGTGEGLDACAKCGRAASNDKSDNFKYAVDFTLNQYEFLAASARIGSVELELLRQTVRGTILGLLTTFEPYVRAERLQNPLVWSNLTWLANEFAPADWAFHDGRLGPRPHFASGF
ncbi:MAG: DUF4760 domain-containing protein [Maritimibacter sp.]